MVWGRDTGFQAGILDSFGHSGPCSSTGLLPASVNSCKGAPALGVGVAVPFLKSSGGHFLALGPVLTQKRVPGTTAPPEPSGGATMLWGQCHDPAVLLQCDCAVMAFIWGGKESQENVYGIKAN